MNQVERRGLNYTAEHLRSELSQKANCPLCMNDVESLIADCLTLHARLAAFEQLRAAADDAHVHVLELRDAWRTGAINECDGSGGTRSNRNVDVEVSLRAAFAALPPASEKGGA